MLSYVFAQNRKDFPIKVVQEQGTYRWVSYWIIYEANTILEKTFLVA